MEKEKRLAETEGKLGKTETKSNRKLDRDSGIQKKENSCRPNHSRFRLKLTSYLSSMVMWFVSSFSPLMALATGSSLACASFTMFPISVQSI